jgi:hypothetical protein
MIVQLTNKRDITLNWKCSANFHYRHLYCITIIITVSIVVLMLELVRGVTYGIFSLHYSLIIPRRLFFVITYEQEQNSLNKMTIVCACS